VLFCAVSIAPLGGLRRPSNIAHSADAGVRNVCQALRDLPSKATQKKEAANRGRPLVPGVIQLSKLICDTAADRVFGDLMTLGKA
jgi:hypothetical protein